MTNEDAITLFAALAQPTRLNTFKLLVAHEPEGLPAGEIAQHLAVPHNTMSSHLAILTHAGLIGATRYSRSIIYRAKLERIQALLAFVLKDCCAGRPEICQPLIDDLIPCCPSKETERV
jgi:DNA-binding transcriptional ArsR family regulator